jgi:hypothetical protein
VQESLEEKLGAGNCMNRNVERPWNNIKKCLLDAVSDFVGKLRREQETHGLRKKLSVKWMNEGNGRASIMKKEEETTED